MLIPHLAEALNAEDLTLQKPWMPKTLASATCLFIRFRRFSKSARLLLYLSKTNGASLLVEDT